MKAVKALTEHRKWHGGGAKNPPDVLFLWSYFAR